LTAPTLAAGKWRIAILAHSLVSGQFNGITTTDVFVTAPGPVMSIDAPGGGAVFSSTAFVVAGWAIDRAATSGPGVDGINIWAIPNNGGSAIFAGAGGYGVSRSDVGGAYGGQFTNSGFATWVSALPPGGYTLVIFGHSTVSGTFSLSRSVQITVH
jgi:hypothetical protein